MAWSFETDPEFQAQLDWVETFVREEVEPLDMLLGSQWNIHTDEFQRLVRPLQETVKARGLWASHLGPELGGKGYGQVALALLNEVLGQSRFGPIVFGVQAPDTGNAEILAHYGTPEQKARFLEPLLDNRIVSCFAMTEPQGGADPTLLRTRAVPDGDGWVLDGEKWFASSAPYAAFYIVMAVTDPDAAPHRRASMFLVPADTPGIEMLARHGFYGEEEDSHGHVRFAGVRVPADAMLGGRGDAFVVAQVRLGGGRMHHAMRVIAQARRAFELMCRRVLSRTTKGERLADKQMVQEKIADSWVQLRQFRLLVLETAWLIDRDKDYKGIRRNISAVKMEMPRVLHDIAARALHLHGSLGLSHESPFAEWVVNSFHVGLADGPTEVHKVTVARETLKEFKPFDADLPDFMRSRRKDAARALYPVADI